jgi:replication initiation and membrane attachment protein DnaB
MENEQTENEQQQQQATEADLVKLCREYRVNSQMENYLRQDVKRGVLSVEELRAAASEHFRHNFPNSDESRETAPEPPPMGSRADDVAGFDEPPKPILNPRGRN